MSGFWRQHGAPEIVVELAILVAAYAVSRLVAALVVHAVSRAAARRESISKASVHALETPTSWALFLIGVVIAFHRLPLTSRWLHRLDELIFALAVMLVATTLARAFRLSIAWYGADAHLSEQDRFTGGFGPLFSKVGTLFIGLLAMITLLEHFGVNVASLVVSLGVGSLAVGWAAQDTLSNMFAGFTLMLDRPFRVGDRIQIASGEVGEVESIGMRSTLIRMPEQTVLVVPNAVLVKDRLLNQTRLARHALVRLDLSVAYGSDLEQVRRILLESTRQVQGMDDGWAPQVVLQRLVDGALQLSLVVRASDSAEQVAVRSRLLERVYARLLAEGIKVPSPHAVVHPKTGGAGHSSEV